MPGNQSEEIKARKKHFRPTKDGMVRPNRGWLVAFWSLVLAVSLHIPPHVFCAEKVAFPKGIASDEIGIAFVEDAAKGVVALDLKTGQPLWTSKEARQPLALSGQRLLATPAIQTTGALPLLILDAKTGKRIVATKAINLPGWALPESSPGVILSLKAQPAQENFTLQWRAQSRYAGGAPPPESILNSETREADGSVQVDSKNGEVTAAQSPQPTGVAPAKRASAPYVKDGDWRDAAWAVDDISVALDLQEKDGRQNLRVRRWAHASATELPPSAPIAGEFLVSTVSPDGRHIFTRDESTASAAKPMWKIFSVGEGKLLGEIDYPEGANLPCVIGQKAFYLLAAGPENAKLVAVEIPSNKVSWDYTLQIPHVLQQKALPR